MRFRRFFKELSNPEKYFLDFFQKISLAYNFFNRNELRNHAAACAYYMLLSLIPLVLLLLYIFDTFLNRYPAFSDDIFTVLSMFNEKITPEMFEKFGISKAAGSAIGIFGIFNLLFSSRLILGSIQRAFSIIFPAEKKRNFLLENAISLGILPAAFILVLLIGVFNSTKDIIYKYLELNNINLEIIQPLFNAAALILPASTGFVIVYFIYRYLPVRKPGTGNALKGALLFMVIFAGSRSVAVVVFKHIAGNTAYGLLGSLIIVLIWSYFVFLLFLFCAQYVFVNFRSDILILNRLFSDDDINTRFVQMNKKVLEKYTQTFEADEVIIESGSGADNVYYVISGGLEVLDPDGGSAYIKTGEMFGEVAHLMCEPHRLTVKAAERSEVLVLDREVFDNVLRGNADLAKRIMELLCRRLRDSQDLKEPVV
ncbi:cyclic nucleotide-binding protein [Denitrovibrio acetiphilus DSM 12809]|uniref:Cyclic nucleotide-binding protein n=1 Tax=Denitrovibrio acetiphilus (strain DSM 12809 / NBRC 114555 / N2460) TaxID=522772 RepID=D4H322_DENA2|nr:cyclic nucleotide-binding protein [Denitrovibrio acetiphilus DSM 12809]